MDYDGYEPKQITADGFLNLMPRWSPDRRFIVFTAYRSRNTQDIDILELRPANVGRWSPWRAEHYPGLVPDGNFLDFFASSQDGNSEIYKLDTRTKASQRLTVNQGGDLSPTWSPTGRNSVHLRSRWAPRCSLWCRRVQCAPFDL